MQLIPTTNQEAFDHAVNYFATQQAKCQSETRIGEFKCAYVGPNGTHCVAGDMINGVENLRNALQNIQVVIDCYAIETWDVSHEFLTSLQNIHDDAGYNNIKKMSDVTGFEFGIKSAWSSEGGLSLTGWQLLLDLGSEYGLDISSVANLVAESAAKEQQPVNA